MDRMQVCGTCDPGSIPGESTKEKAPSGAFFICALTVTVWETVTSGIENLASTFVTEGKQKGDKVYRSCNERFLVILEIKDSVLWLGFFNESKKPKTLRGSYSARSASTG
jgi:hypothetical protein